MLLGHSEEYDSWCRLESFWYSGSVASGRFVAGVGLATAVEVQLAAAINMALPAIAASSMQHLFLAGANRISQLLQHIAESNLLRLLNNMQHKIHPPESP